MQLAAEKVTLQTSNDQAARQRMTCKGSLIARSASTISPPLPAPPAYTRSSVRHGQLLEQQEQQYGFVFGIWDPRM